MVPNVGKRIPVSRSSFFVYFHVYNFARDPESDASKLIRPLFRLPQRRAAQQNPAFPINKHYADTTAVQSEFPLSNFQPGEYRLLAEVTDEISGEVAKGECSFSIVSTSVVPDLAK